MALMSRTQIGMKRTGVTCTVPNNPKAKLMYYLKSMCTVLGMDDDSDIRPFINYDNYWRLTEQQTQQVILLCALLSPDVLLNKCIFQDDALCGDSSNEFYELSAVSHRLLVSNSIMIGGQQRRVRKIMTFKMSWLRENYLEPIQHFQREMEAEKRRREREQCTIL